MTVPGEYRDIDNDVLNNDTVKVYYNELRDDELNKEYYAVYNGSTKA